MRVDGDRYMTPEWVVDALLRRWTPPPGRLWVEPAVGTGNIVRACHARIPGIQWDMFDVCLDGAPEGTTIDDFLGWADKRQPHDTRYDVAITNPPYSMALEFVQACLRTAAVSVLLLRLAFLESQKRTAFLRGNMPDVYVLPRRPSFVGGRTDSSAYAWFVWPTTQPRDRGVVEVLGMEG